MTNAYLENIERWTGDRPETCPWRAFYDPFVGFILRAYQFFESGQLEQFWGGDPPPQYTDGVVHYHRALKRVQGYQQEADRKKRDAERARNRGGR
jgi:hypothetical protein